MCLGLCATALAEEETKNSSPEVDNSTTETQTVDLEAAKVDADMLNKLEEKQKAGERLERKELLNVLLTSLMDGEMSQEIRVKRSLGILQREQEYVDKGQMCRCSRCCMPWL